MSKTPYFKFYPSDFLGDTMLLSAEAVGAYVLLLCAMWNAGGRLPNDDRKLAQLARIGARKWPGVWGELAAFFEVELEFIWHKRLTLERDKVAEISSVRSTSGCKGGRAKALKNNEATLANASGVPDDLPEVCSGKQADTRARSNTRSQIPEEGDKSPSEELSLLSVAGAPNDPDPVLEAFENYNATASRLGLPQATKLTDSRRKHLKARLREHRAEGWALALRNLETSPHLLGRNDRGWKADLDFLLRPDKLLRVIEGGYCRPGAGGPTPTGRQDWI